MVCRSTTTWVFSWESSSRSWRGIPTTGDQPGRIPAAAGSVDAAGGHKTFPPSRQVRNFAFDLVVRKTSDEDLDGFNLGKVHSIFNGSERVQPVTLKRFADRFARFSFDPKALRPSYGMAEATVYIATRENPVRSRRLGTSTLRSSLRDKPLRAASGYRQHH